MAQIPDRFAGWLRDEGFLALVAAAETMGGQVLAVGGAVRDSLLGRTDIDDYDIVVGLPPETVGELLSRLGWRHRRHPFRADTVFASSDGPGIGHYGLTFLGPIDEASLAADAAARDFTCNALYCKPDGEVLDPLGRGILDMLNRTVALASANSLLADPVRVLRYPRMRTRLGRAGIPEPSIRASLSAAAPGLAGMPPLRCMRELSKLLDGITPREAGERVDVLDRCGALDILFPHADRDLFSRLLGSYPDGGDEGVDARVLIAVLGLAPGPRGGVAFDGRRVAWGTFGRDRFVEDCVLEFSGRRRKAEDPAGRFNGARLLLPEACALLRRLGRGWRATGGWNVKGRTVTKRDGRGASVRAMPRTSFRA